MADVFIPVVLSGGSGTRLWPVSRASFPKQFCQLFEESLLEKTIKRLSPLGDPMILTVESLRALTEIALESQNMLPTQALFEPCPKNTAPAIAFLCQCLRLRNKSNAIVGLFPSDALINHEAIFYRAVQLAIQCARKNQVVTVGITPRYAATGFGYIELGDLVQSEAKKNDSEASDLASLATVSFREKPNHETAARFLQQGNFVWNAGIFVFRVSDMIAHFEKLVPDAWNHMCQLKPDLSNLKDVYSHLQSQSFDIYIMERLTRSQSCCIPADIGWSDVGCWDEVSRLKDITINGDDKGCNHLLEGAHNCFIFPHELRQYALIGVEDLLIVDSGDALLIAKKGESQRVKDIVNKLESHKHRCAKEHAFAVHSWGNIEGISENENYICRRIKLNPMQQIVFGEIPESMQPHPPSAAINKKKPLPIRSPQSWVPLTKNLLVTHGIAAVTVGDVHNPHQVLSSGNSMWIKNDEKQFLSIKNMCEDMTELLEISLKHHVPPFE